MKTVGIIQARMKCERLPGKVLIPVVGQTLLAHQVERLGKCKGLNALAVATGEGDDDDPIARECSRIGIPCFRGDSEDVLDLFLNAAREYKAEAVARFTADCPLIDPGVATRIIWHFLANDFALVGCAGSIPHYRTFPRGLDTEVFSMELLEEAAEKADQPGQRTDVTAYIYETYPDRVYYYPNKTNQSRHDWTVSSEEDLELIRGILSHLYHGDQDFFLDDILALLEDHPELADLSTRVR